MQVSEATITVKLVVISSWSKIKMLKELIISMRPHQWYKNLVIFVGIVFSLNLLSFTLWPKVLLAFAVFCMLSGSEYIVNDILDVEKDRKHPKKCKRPIASGALKVKYALPFTIILTIVALIVASLINLEFLLVSIAYFVLVLLYSTFLKNIVIIDILTISVGFVIRAVAGCLAIKVFVSPWLIICAFLLALFLAIGKRKHELVLMNKEAKQHRKVLGKYSKDFLEQMLTISAASLIMAYSLYTFLTGKVYMMITLPFAFYGLFRCYFLIESKNFGGEPELIFKDKGLLIGAVLWILLIAVILYV